MANRLIQTIANVLDKTIGAGAKFLDSDFIIPEGNIIRMNLAVNTAATIQYTRNGTKYNPVNTSVTQLADDSYMYRFMIRSGEAFNIKTVEGVALDINFLTIELWLEI